MKKVIFMFVAAAALTFAACDEKKAETPAAEEAQTEAAAPEVKDGEAPAADADAAAPEAKKDEAPEAKKDEAAPAPEQKADEQKPEEEKK